MRRAIVLLGLSVLALPGACGFANCAEPQAASEETAAEKLRRALEGVRDVEIANLPLDAAVNQLREQTGLNLLVDHTAVPPSVTSPVEQGPLATVPNPAFSTQLRLRGEFHGMPLRTALTKLLRDHNLTHVIVGDTVLITTTEKAVERQFGQSVSIKVVNTKLSDELRRLARQTAANIVLDPRRDKEGQTFLSLDLHEVPLETVVELLADEAGLRAVRLNNVLYVTSEARAEKLRKPPAPSRAIPGFRVYPDGNGGFRMTPPAGAGIGGGGGRGGFAGNLGGGALGAGGGFTGVAPPVPLTPPLPKTKPGTPIKPAKDKSQAKAIPSRHLVVYRDRIILAAKKADDGKAKRLLDDPSKAQPFADKNDRHRELRRKLDEQVKFDALDDPKTALSEALDFLAKRYNLAFDINEEAFKQAKIKEVGKFPIADSAPIPEMHAKLETVLRKILNRVSPSTTFLVRGYTIEITTTKAIRKEFFADRPPARGPLPPLVSVAFDKVPLEAALKELGRSGNIALDSRAAKEAQMAVTAELTNVPLDTTVRMLADMAGLKVVPLDNALYVTSKDNARVLLEEQEKQRLHHRQEKKKKAKSEEKPSPPKSDKPAEDKPAKPGTTDRPE